MDSGSRKMDPKLWPINCLAQEHQKAQNSTETTVIDNRVKTEGLPHDVNHW